MLSQYATFSKKVTVTCTCGCGHRFRCRLENRRQYRKGVDLPGRFTLLGEDGTKDTGLVRVVDISATGLQMQLTVARSFSVGAELIIEFRLDDRKRTAHEKTRHCPEYQGAIRRRLFSPQRTGRPCPWDFICCPECPSHFDGFVKSFFRPPMTTHPKGRWWIRSGFQPRFVLKSSRLEAAPKNRSPAGSASLDARYLRTRFIPRQCGVRSGTPPSSGLTSLDLDLLTNPSEMRFLQVHQAYICFALESVI